MIKLNLSPERRVLRQFAWFGVIGLPFLTAFIVKTATGAAWSEQALWGHLAVLIVLGVAVTAVVTFEWRRPARPRCSRGCRLWRSPSASCSHVLIAAIYYLVLTPIALVFRVTGRGVIGRQLDRGGHLWRERSDRRRRATSSSTGISPTCGAGVVCVSLHPRPLAAVSRLALGGWLTFGDQVEDGDALALRAAYDAGVNSRPSGCLRRRRRQSLVGRFVRRCDRTVDPRQQGVLATSADPQDRGLSRRHIHASSTGRCAPRRRALGLYYHRETVRAARRDGQAMGDLVRAGKVRGDKHGARDAAPIASP